MTFVVGYSSEGADASWERGLTAYGTFILQFSPTVANTGSGARSSALFVEA